MIMTHTYAWFRRARVAMSHLPARALRRAALLAVICPLLLAAEFAGAQDIVGRISGTVTDARGAVVPHAKVTITNQETNVERTVSADDHGYYVAPELPAGTYSVTAEK